MSDLPSERGSGNGRSGRTSRTARAPLVVLLFLVVLLPVARFGPGEMAAVQRASAQSVPGWMTPEQATRFTNDWPALVPSWLPEPFASVTPSITVSSGTYQLYWLVTGGSPTFLVVTGTVGGAIPAGSIYDLNVELVVNATVRGYEAYHDLTPIYDAVYWREGNITYSANSQGLSTDIVSYADAFTEVTAPAPAPTATVATPVSLISPDAVASGSIATVTSRGGGTGATLTADGGIFADTGTGRYPGAGDAAVTWVAPDVAVDTMVTFSLLDGNGAVLVTTPTLVTAAIPPARFALDCAPSVAAGDTLAVAITGSGNVMLGASDGFWPQTSPNTDYDPGTDGGTLAFSLAGGGTATLIWAAPEVPGFVTLTATGSSGMTVASCGIDVVGAEATSTATTAAESTLPVATSTAPPPVWTSTATVQAPEATAPAVNTATASAPDPTLPSVAPTQPATVPGTNPGDGTDTGFDQVPTAPATNPTATGSGAGAQPTVPGSNPGDGIDAGLGSESPAPTARAGDGTDFGGVATVPPAATYPAIPTSAPLPSAPPTSVPPTGIGTGETGQTGPVTNPISPVPMPALGGATVTPVDVTATPVRPTATMRPATGDTLPATIPAEVTATAVRPSATAAAPTLTPTSQPPSIAAVPTRSSTAMPPVTPLTATTAPPTPTVPRPSATAPPASPVPPTAAVPATSETATPAPPTATSTRRPPTTSTVTPVRPGQAAASIDASPALPSVEVGLDQTPPAIPAASPRAPSPTPTSPPATSEAIQQDVGPAGGTVAHPAGGWLDVAEGTFGSTMTVSMAQLPDTELPVSPDVELIPSTGYEIHIRSADGAAMTTLPTGVTLNLSLPEAQRSEAVVYWIDGERLTRLQASDTNEAGVSVPMEHLSRYVAGIPVTETPRLNWLPWVVAIAAAVSGLLVVGLLAQNIRRQRRHDSARRTTV